MRSWVTCTILLTCQLLPLSRETSLTAVFLLDSIHKQECIVRGFISDNFEVGILKLDIIVDKKERFKSILVHGSMSTSSV